MSNRGSGEENEQIKGKNDSIYAGKIWRGSVFKIFDGDYTCMHGFIAIFKEKCVLLFGSCTFDLCIFSYIFQKSYKALSGKSKISAIRTCSKGKMAETEESDGTKEDLSYL